MPPDPPSPAPTAAALRDAIPAAVSELMARLREAGHEAVLVGGCVRGMLSGQPVHDFDVATSAPPDAVLALFPRAVPVGLRHGTVMIPTAAGPVDVTQFRGAGGLADDLARRDFTVNALALDPRDGVVTDLASGREDLEAGRLRAVGSAEQRLREDPLRAFRATRFRSTLGLEPDAELEAAMAATAQRVEALAGIAGERLREEIARLLLGDAAGPALELLRRSGLEAALAPGVRDDAAAVVAALPRQLEVRLTGWLRGARAAAVLARLRSGRARARKVERLLALHPVEERADAASPAGLRRLLARSGPERVADAIALGRAELAAQPAGKARSDREAALTALEEGLTAVQRDGELALERDQLVVDGRQVMEWLGCGPGREVGAALRHLTERVIEDPALNQAERLHEELLRWREPRSPAGKRATR